MNFVSQPLDEAVLDAPPAERSTQAAPRRASAAYDPRAAAALAPARWPAPDPRHRADWRLQRTLIERSSEYHTPWGRIRRRRYRPLELACRSLRATLERLDLLSAVARSALSVRLTELELGFANLPAAFHGYTILQIADPHFDALPGLGDAILAACRGLEVDLCVFNGDYRGREFGPFTEHANFDDLIRIVDAVAARDGAIAVLGNHDTHDMVPALETMVGLRVLTNEAVDVVRGRDRIALVGLDDVHRFYSASTRRFLASLQTPSVDFRVMLVHSPELAENAARLGCSLYLCGHTHGGQICLPGGRPILRHLHAEHALASGLWRRGQLIGYTSTGAGVAESLPVRLFSASEITLLRLHAVDPAGG